MIRNSKKAVSLALDALSKEPKHEVQKPAYPNYHKDQR